MTFEQDQRRFHLMHLMSRANLNCRKVAEMLDRKAQTVRCWRSGMHPMPDHSLALLELLIRHGYTKNVKGDASGI